MLAGKEASKPTLRSPETGFEQSGVIALHPTADPEMGEYDNEPTVIFRHVERPSAGLG
jgi:hypothetical protein